MAPSRDRLLHFGFKATVSDRGKGKGVGWPGRIYVAAQATGEEATRLRRLDGLDRKLRCLLGGCVPSPREGD